MASAILQAALSHYIAKRDKAIAELDVYINRPVGVGEHANVVNEVITLFSDLEQSESIIATIRNIVNSQQSEVDLLREQLRSQQLRETTNKAEPQPESTGDEQQISSVNPAE